MKHRTTQAIYDYWGRRRGARNAPRRADIEPSDIHALLGDTFILECDGPHRTPFRLAGTRICVLFNRELKGADYFGLWRPRDREAIAASLRATREEAACHLIGWRGRTAGDYEISGELVQLPLTMGGMRIARVLGAMVPYGLPVWLGSVPLAELELRTIRRLDIDSDRPARPTTPDPEAISGDPRSDIRRVGHLSVYAGGRDGD